VAACEEKMIILLVTGTVFHLENNTAQNSLTTAKANGKYIDLSLTALVICTTTTTPTPANTEY
jgi:hypothetical protein